MPRHLRMIAPAAIVAVLTPFAVTTFPLGPATAADCIAAPNSAAPEGSHWYYRTDREKRRKCWYIAREDRTVRQTVRRSVAQVEPPRTARAQETPPPATSPAPTARAQATPAATSGPTPPATSAAPRLADATDGPLPLQQVEAPASAWPTSPAVAPNSPVLAFRSIDPLQPAETNAADATATSEPAPDIATSEPAPDTATSAPAPNEDATTGANADARDDALPAEDLEDAAATAMTFTPMRKLVLLLCGLAVIGAFLYEITQLRERRRQARLDRFHLQRRRLNRDGGSREPRERVAAPTDGLRPPPPWARLRPDPRSDDEPTLRRMTRGEERPALSGEPAA